MSATAEPQGRAKPLTKTAKLMARHMATAWSASCAKTDPSAGGGKGRVPLRTRLGLTNSNHFGTDSCSDQDIGQPEPHRHRVQSLGQPFPRLRRRPGLKVRAQDEQRAGPAVCLQVDAGDERAV